MQKIKSGKATGTSEVSVKIIAASGKIRVKVIKNLCQHVLDGIQMPNEWNTRVIVAIFKRNSGVMSHGSYRGVKLLENGMKNVERKLEANTNVDQFEWNANWIYARKTNRRPNIYCEDAEEIKKGQEIVYVFC